MKCQAASSGSGKGNGRDDVVVVVPLHRPQLTALESFSLGHSLAQLKRRRRVVFIGPQGLDLSAYRQRLGKMDWKPFDADHFASVQGYSRLLTSAPFYEQFADHEFMLVLQPDALLLRDELDAWTQRPFDYVGAPWPDGVEIFINLDRFGGEAGVRIKAHVGNGGFSLRRNRACVALLKEFPQALQYFQLSGSSEDLFFAFMGQVSTRFVLPNEMTAARFALELKPQRYRLIDPSPPMGGHAWWKYDPVFWLDQLGDAATPALRQAVLVEAQKSQAAAAARVQASESVHAAV